MMRSAGLCATLATAAQAFLVPSTMSLDDKQDDVGLLHGVDPFTSLMKLPCKDCLYAQPFDEGFAWTQGVENALFLNFSISNDYKAILLNDYQIYPPLLSFDFFSGDSPTTLSIAQIPASASISEVTANPDQFITKPLRLTDWRTSSGVVKTDATGDQVVSIDFGMGALEGQHLNIPDVKITALKQTTGKLVILDTEEQERKEVESSGLDNICQSMPLFCEIRDKLSGKLSGLRGKVNGMRKGCHGKHISPNGMRPHEMRPHRPGNPKHGKFGSPHHMEDDHHHKGHHGHHEHKWHGHGHHHDMHRFLHRAMHVVWAVLLPILIGFAVGVALYFVGFLAGAVIALVLGKFMRSQRGYEVVLAEEEEEDDKDDIEKAHYIVIEEEPLPVYVEVVDQKTEQQ